MRLGAFSTEFRSPSPLTVEKLPPIDAHKQNEAMPDWAEAVLSKMFNDGDQPKGYTFNLNFAKYDTLQQHPLRNGSRMPLIRTNAVSTEISMPSVHKNASAPSLTAFPISSRDRLSAKTHSVNRSVSPQVAKKMEPQRSRHHVSLRETRLPGGGPHEGVRSAMMNGQQLNERIVTDIENSGGWSVVLDLSNRDWFNMARIFQMQEEEVKDLGLETAPALGVVFGAHPKSPRKTLPADSTKAHNGAVLRQIAMLKAAIYRRRRRVKQRNALAAAAAAGSNPTGGTSSKVFSRSSKPGNWPAPSRQSSKTVVGSLKDAVAFDDGKEEGEYDEGEGASAAKAGKNKQGSAAETALQQVLAALPVLDIQRRRANLGPHLAVGGPAVGPSRSRGHSRSDSGSDSDPEPERQLTEEEREARELREEFPWVQRMAKMLKAGNQDGFIKLYDALPPNFGQLRLERVKSNARKLAGFEQRTGS